MARDDDVQWLREQVQWLRDVEEIKQLRARYCRVVDSQDWDAWGREVITEDFHFDSDGGIQDGRDQVIAFVSRALLGGSTVHHCHTPEIEITGTDTATGVWAMQDHVKLPHDGKVIMFRGAGHYREEYVRTDQGWRIRSTKLTRLSIDPLPAPDSDPAPA
jgi:SnoaL-like domain